MCMIYFVCMYVCSPCMYLVPTEAREGIRSPETGVTDGSNHYSYWESVFGSLEEQPVLFNCQVISLTGVANVQSILS